MPKTCSNEPSLEQTRAQIDRIDAELVRLFLSRMEASRTVARIKQRQHLPVLNPEREEEVLRSRSALAADPHLSKSVEALFREIMQLSREEQFRYLDQGLVGQAIAYSGAPGAFSESAAVGFFGEGCTRLNFRTFDEVFAAVAEDRARYGVVPVENTSSGSISDVYDLLGQYACHIVGEQLVRVEHCLLGLPGATIEGIRTVYSHEQGFAQCRDFLGQHSDWTLSPHFNTAIAARRVAASHDPSCAAIASRLAAAHYGLEVLVPDIHSRASNRTRFVVVSASPRPIGQPDKATLTFTLRHERGTLQRALSAFVALGMNLTHIESRPLPGSDWEYCFYADLTGNIQEENLAVLLRALREDAVSCRILGVYCAAQ